MLKPMIEATAIAVPDISFGTPASSMVAHIVPLDMKQSVAKTNVSTVSAVMSSAPPETLAIYMMIPNMSTKTTI